MSATDHAGKWKSRYAMRTAAHSSQYWRRTYDSDIIKPARTANKCIINIVQPDTLCAKTGLCWVVWCYIFHRGWATQQKRWWWWNNCRVATLHNCEKKTSWISLVSIGWICWLVYYGQMHIYTYRGTKSCLWSK